MATSGSSGGPGGDWAFTGRDVERRSVVAALGAGGVVLVGDAGVGKSRLAGDVAASLDARVVRLVGSPALREVPLAALLPLLEARPADVFAAAEALRSAVAQDDVLLVDDAQWLDEVSAALLLQLVSTGGCRVLATVRAGEQAPAAVVQLWKDGAAQRLDLAPFTPEQTRAVVEARLGAPMDGASAHRIHDLASGNALYVRELVEASLAGETLVERGGVWRLVSVAPSPRLADLVGDVLGALKPSARDVADLLAIADSMGRTSLVALASEEGVAAAQAEGVVVVAPEGLRETCRLRHPLMADVLRADIDPYRRRQLTQAITDELTARGARRTLDELRIVSLRVDAGLPVDPMALYVADDQYRSMRGGQESRFDRELALIGYDKRRQVVGEFNVLDAELDAAVAEQRRLLDEARAAGDDDAVDHATLLSFILAEHDRPAEAAAVLDEVDGLFPQWSARIEAARAQAASSAGDATQLARWLQLWDDFAEAEPLVRLRLGASLQVTVLLAGAPELGAVSDSMVAIDAERSRRFGLAHRSSMTRGTQGVGDALVLRAGSADEVRTAIQAVYAEASEQGFDFGVISSVAGLAVLESIAGDPAATDRCARELAGLAEHLGDEGLHRAGLGLVCVAAAQAADGVAAEAALGALAAAQERGAARTLRTLTEQRGRAWALAATGRLGTALSAALVAVEDAREAAQWGVLPIVAHDALRLGADPTDVLTALLAVPAGMRSPMHSLVVSHAAARSADGPVALETAAVALSGAGLGWAAAEAWTEAANRWQAAGEPRSEAAARRAAAEAAASVGCTLLPLPGIEARLPAVALTRRELEVAALAAAGRTDREIADELHLGVRTVEGHLSRAYLKLGISRRGDLAAALRT